MITIQINNLKYGVLLCGSDNANLTVDGQLRIGTCEPAGGSIYIHEGTPYEMTRKAILHELTHAYMFAYGHGKREKFYEEDVCEFMSSFAVPIMYDTDAILKHYDIKPDESNEEKER